MKSISCDRTTCQLLLSPLQVLGEDPNTQQKQDFSLKLWLEDSFERELPNTLPNTAGPLGVEAMSLRLGVEGSQNIWLIQLIILFLFGVGAILSCSQSLVWAVLRSDSSGSWGIICFIGDLN